MSFEYFVAVDASGHAGLAATKRSAVESDIAEHGGHLVAVRAANAFAARRKAEAAESGENH
ncbi:MAG TPA: hypothetical protein VM661_10775 [Candidatus Sulfotelmatobacter sp.]|jgi:hypothetical protein|nr:hypothetical protein [Candidatus Sulfotelmatobacter sp.]